MSEKIKQVKRGEIYWVKFDKKSVGTEIRKPRPAVIVSNDWQNEEKHQLLTQEILKYSWTLPEVKELERLVGLAEKAKK